MAEAPTTRPSLLLRLRDAQDGEAWAEFVDLYAPLVYGLARRQGLQDADAADLTQEVLRAVAAAAGRFDYDPARGSFRGWLFTVARNQVHHFVAGLRRREQGSGDSSVQGWLEQVPDPQPGQEAQWEEDYRRRLFACAAERVRAIVHEPTWQAFWRTAVEGQSGAEVAESLGLSVPAVYLARSRVTARLREQVQQLEEKNDP